MHHFPINALQAAEGFGRSSAAVPVSAGQGDPLKPPCLVTCEELRSLLSYDGSSGLFTWRGARSQLRAGSPAGQIWEKRRSKYWVIRIRRRLYQAHRLAWLYVHGSWPLHQIDHIDGDGLNNAIANLRDVPARVNSENRRRAKPSSKTGLLGVFVAGRRYGAQITVRGVNHNLGRFDTAEAAHAAYLGAKRELHEGCTL
jgi:hypothetical protein